MDVNLVVLAGKLAAPPEHRRFESGSSLLRSLVTVRSDAPRRRVDVVPVTLWNPGDDHELLGTTAGTPVWVVGTVQRRFWTKGETRTSRLEVVAHQIEPRPKPEVSTTSVDSTGGVDLQRVD